MPMRVGVFSFRRIAMNKITLSIALFAYLGSITVAVSQDVQVIIEKNAANFSPISSLSFSATQVCVIQMPGPELNKKITDKIQFDASGDKFTYTVEQSSELPGNHYHKASGAYNGESLQTLLGTTLAIKTESPSSIPSLSQELFLIAPYAFVEAAAAANPEYQADKTFVLTPNQLINPQYWKTLLTSVKSISSGSMEGKQGLIMKLSGELWGEPIDMSVLFDPTQNYYPMAWERSNSRGFRQSYVVSDLEYVRAGSVSLPYPKKAILTKYAGAEPGSICTISVDNVAINNISPDDNRFTIDPAQASYINDVDKKVLIPVPK
jgi:hypothetical protein